MAAQTPLVTRAISEISVLNRCLSWSKFVNTHLYHSSSDSDLHLTCFTHYCACMITNPVYNVCTRALVCTKQCSELQDGAEKDSWISKYGEVHSYTNETVLSVKQLEH